MYSDCSDGGSWEDEFDYDSDSGFAAKLFDDALVDAALRNGAAEAALEQEDGGDDAVEWGGRLARRLLAADAEEDEHARERRVQRHAELQAWMRAAREEKRYHESGEAAKDQAASQLEEMRSRKRALDAKRAAAAAAAAKHKAEASTRAAAEVAKRMAAEARRAVQPPPPRTQQKERVVRQTWHCKWCRDGKFCNWCGECGDGQLFSIRRLGYDGGDVGCARCIRRKSGLRVDDGDSDWDDDRDWSRGYDRQCW
jgi:hypothetical protein